MPNFQIITPISYSFEVQVSILALSLPEILNDMGLYQTSGLNPFVEVSPLSLDEYKQLAGIMRVRVQNYLIFEDGDTLRNFIEKVGRFGQCNGSGRLFGFHAGKL